MMRVLFFSILSSIVQSVTAQRNTISVGPMLSVSESMPDRKDKTGLGGSVEFYHQVFHNSGLRVFAGIEKFQEPGTTNSKVGYLSLRAGYQYSLFKNRLQLWADAGMASIQYPSGPDFNEFTFSTGGGYTQPVSKKGFLQLQAFYVYTDNIEIYDDFNNYGWVTFRIAYGLLFGK